VAAAQPPLVVVVSRFLYLYLGLLLRDLDQKLRAAELRRNGDR